MAAADPATLSNGPTEADAATDGSAPPAAEALAPSKRDCDRTFSGNEDGGVVSEAGPASSVLALTLTVALGSTIVAALVAAARKC